ncbi:MAG: hypothetical protein H0V66_08315 [Bdellovibrionales bacterium]|nr:hypothetical protein [Bdellovibrionales bacterium]
MKIFMLLLVLSVKAYSETQVFEALAKKDGQIAYVEKHTVVYDEQTVIKSLTEYLDPDGKVIATMNSDFTRNVGAPEFILRDQRHESFQGLKWKQGKPEIFSREAKKKLVAHKVLSLDQKEVPISGPGLIYFVAANLEKIISQEILEFQYIIPGRLEAFDFYIKTLAHNHKVAEFEVSIKSWLLRLFGPRLKLIYDIQKKRVVSFEGISNLRDGEGKMMSVDIQYKYHN